MALPTSANNSNNANGPKVIVHAGGLTDNLQVSEIVEIARKGPLRDAAARLAAAAERRMNREREGRPSKPDDLTFALFRLGSER